MHPDSLDLLVEKQKRWFRPVARGLLLILTAFFLLMLGPAYKTAAILLFSAGALYLFFIL